MKKRADVVFNGLENVPDIRIEYKGYTIKPKLDFGGYPYRNVNKYRKGYVVVKRGINVMPGATWATSVIEAKEMVESYIEEKGDGEKFWEIIRKKQGRDEYVEL